MLGFLVPKARSQVPTITDGPGTFSVELVGDAYYQKALARICGGKPQERYRHRVEAVLIPDDDHPHKSKVVRVFIEDQLVGFLNRDREESLRRSLASVAPRSSVAKCPAMIVAHRDREQKDRGQFTVRLDLPFS